jgi:hypothetical protein
MGIACIKQLNMLKMLTIYLNGKKLTFKDISKNPHIEMQGQRVILQFNFYLLF